MKHIQMVPIKYPKQWCCIEVGWRPKRRWIDTLWWYDRQYCKPWSSDEKDDEENYSE